MAFIRTIPPSEAEGPVREMYEQAHGRFGYVPNWTQAFSLRPGVRDGRAVLLKSIQSALPARSYELATLAAARALRSSYCSLAHGSVLADKAAREHIMKAFVEKVALNADRITSADIDALRSHGHRDEEIFDLVAVQADSTFNDLDPTLRQALTVGRRVADRPE